MKLRYSPTSPYVRKVSITAIETGLADKIERVTTDPWSAETDLGNSNPIGKVPCLITDDGMAIYDSPVICEYLDSLNTGEKLIPASGEARFKALTLAAIELYENPELREAAKEEFDEARGENYKYQSILRGIFYIFLCLYLNLSQSYLNIFQID